MICLTSARWWGMVEAPKYTDRRTASAIPVFPPRAGKSTRKSIAGSSAYHALPEFIRQMCIGIGRYDVRDNRKAPAAYQWAGEHRTCLFFIFNSKNTEVHHGQLFH